MKGRGRRGIEWKKYPLRRGHNLWTYMQLRTWKYIKQNLTELHEETDNPTFLGGF